MSDEFHVPRDGRSLVEMVNEELQASGKQYDENPAVSIYSEDESAIYNGLIIDDEDGLPHYGVSVGQQDLSLEDVEAYLDEFYPGSDLVTVEGFRNKKGSHQIDRWADTEGEKQYFYILFGGDSDLIETKEPGNGVISMEAPVEETWENPEKRKDEIVSALNTVLADFNVDKMDRENYQAPDPEAQYPSGRNPRRGNYPGSSMPEKLSERFEVENPEEVKPEVVELVDIYSSLREAGWQVKIENPLGFRVTDHTMKAQSKSRQEFEAQVDWIEDQLRLEDQDREFKLNVKD